MVVAKSVAMVKLPGAESPTCWRATSVESRGKPEDALMTPGQHESLSALAPFDYTALDYLQ